MHEADAEGALAIEPCFSKVHAPTKRYRADDVRTGVIALYREKLGRQVPGEHPCTKGQYESLLTTAIAGLVTNLELVGWGQQIRTPEDCGAAIAGERES
jgi:hypothetical protein